MFSQLCLLHGVIYMTKYRTYQENVKMKTEYVKNQPYYKWFKQKPYQVNIKKVSKK